MRPRTDSPQSGRSRTDTQQSVRPRTDSSRSERSQTTSQQSVRPRTDSLQSGRSQTDSHQSVRSWTDSKQSVRPRTESTIAKGKASLASPQSIKSVSFAEMPLKQVVDVSTAPTYLQKVLLRFDVKQLWTIRIRKRQKRGFYGTKSQSRD